MPETLAEMVLRLARSGALETLVRDSLTRESEPKTIEHKRPHLVRFSTPAKLRIQEFARAPDGSLVAKGDARIENVGPDKPVVRAAGIWSVEVLEGTADFEKDFVRPEDMPTGPREDEE